MFRSLAGTCCRGHGFPRVCGDVPNRQKPHTCYIRFSPRMRGCSVHLVWSLPHLWVFPAYAGMFLDNENATLVLVSFPRVCGDVPPRIMLPEISMLVFPAYAGMFRPPLQPRHRKRSFPHVCGDVPNCRDKIIRMVMFSPRMRGCSCSMIS